MTKFRPGMRVTEKGIRNPRTGTVLFPQEHFELLAVRFDGSDKREHFAVPGADLRKADER